MKDKSLLRVKCPKCGTSYKQGERHACAATASPPREPLLASREHTHGDYSLTATAAQHFKDVFARHRKSTFSPIQQESIDMFATKLARIHCGDAKCVDHWRDLSGYALLVVEELERASVTEPPR